MKNEYIPVITIDGPTASGKGTIAQLLAKKLNWHYLESGLLYRALAFIAKSKKVPLTDDKNLAELAKHLDLTFSIENNETKILLEAQDVSLFLRTEEISKAASQVSQYELVRNALITRQKKFRQKPGLVTDGRDMGTVIFPDADLKIFMTANADERAKRRHSQLQKLGIDGSIDAILSDLQERDFRDRTRKVVPLVPASDAIILDTTSLSVSKTFDQVWQLIQDKGMTEKDLGK